MKAARTLLLLTVLVPIAACGGDSPNNGDGDGDGDIDASADGQVAAFSLTSGAFIEVAIAAYGCERGWKHLKLYGSSSIRRPRDARLTGIPSSTTSGSRDGV